MTEVQGKFIQRAFAVGSKSEHDAVGIDIDGEFVKLRIRGNNPFNDPELNKLIGKDIKACITNINNGQAWLTDWEIIGK